MDAYPLSPMQQGMLFQSISSDASDLYVQQLCCRLSGDLDTEVFRATWEVLQARHAVLRTAFAWRDLPEPLQVVGDRATLPLEVLNWRDAPASSVDDRLQTLRAEERQAGFVLGRAPLMRLRLARLGESRHALIWTWHHIILDAWSVPVLVEEFFSIHAALAAGQDPDLPPARPFKDFISWRQSRSEPAVTGAAQAFWRDALAGFQEPTPLAPRSQPARRAGNRLPDQADGHDAGYGLRFLTVPAVEIEALVDTARRLRLTLNTLVLGAWSLLLSRYSGREDVVFGNAVAGRPPDLSGVESMVGLLINTQPVRSRVRLDTPLKQWLTDLQHRQAEARRFEDTALTDIHGWSEVPRGGPLFESLLVFENYPLDMSRMRGGGLKIEAVDFTERADFPLAVMMAVREESRLGVGYQRDRFDDAAMERLLGHMRALLRSMAIAAPDTRLGDLAFLEPAEHDRITGPWSRAPNSKARGSLDVEVPIHRHFEARARETPNAPAATFAGPNGDECLSHDALNQAANRLARRLVGLGIAAEDRVVVCMEASLARLIAILAILKAGGAYVPLEASFPDARLTAMTRGCGACLVLADMDRRAAFAAAEIPTILTLDGTGMPRETPRAGTSIEDGTGDLDDIVGADNLAYVIHTSGSTGVPKGVAVTHRTLGHLVAAQIEAFEIDASSRVLQFASLIYDASISEIFTALAAGAELYMAPRQVLVPSREFLDLLARWRITTVTLPPSVLAALPSAHLPALSTLVSAGEACGAELVARWAPGRRFLNAYGPAECTVCATIAVVEDHDSPPSIGHAIGDARVYILSPDLRALPVGVVGELFIGGAGVARGYWGRPGQTAGAFWPDPFSDHPGARMYRTGDAARFLENGEIEFLGRLDDQVKIRGMRLEPGEVEAALRADPAVGSAAVVVTDDDRLVAHVVPSPRSASEIRPRWWPSISEFLIYDELAYLAMTNDERRNDAYRAAFAAKVRDRVVLDVGTGPEALLARFCIEAGARKAYAVELLPETHAKAQRRLRELGLEDRIELILGDATQVSLPEHVDFLVSEIVGAIGGSEGAAVILNGAREHLAPHGEMIPTRARTLYAPVELPAALLDNLGFEPLPARYVDRIFEDAGYPFDLRLCAEGLSYAHLLAEPQTFEDLDFSNPRAGPVPPEYAYEAEHRITRAGRLDGFLVWLTLDTGAGELIDILENRHCWLPVFLPAFDFGLAVAVDDVISARCGAVLCEDGVHPDYVVEGTLRRHGQEPVSFAHRATHHAPAFRASPFHERFFKDGEVPRIVEPSQPEAGFDATGLMARLAETLADHMVPASILEVDALPLNASGKVDRRALREVSAVDSEHAKSKAFAPAALDGDMEQVVARIWREVLELDPSGAVGRGTNFFDHGGHSLLLLKVQDALREAVEIEIPVTELFKYPTVESLAGRLDARAAPGAVAKSDRSGEHDRAAARRRALSSGARGQAARRVRGRGA